MRLRPYQEKIVRRVVSVLDTPSRRLVLVMMPTGSGKTIVQMAIARHVIAGSGRVIVLEPTRFLADQMRLKWEREFPGRVDKYYEGECREVDKPIVISTPKTAGKCSIHWGERGTLIVDEVHHLTTSRTYLDVVRRLITDNGVTRIIGFTALVESRKLSRFMAENLDLGRPLVLKYSFRELERLGGYKPPLAIADLFEAELEDWERELLHTLQGRRLNEDRREGRIRALAARYLVKYGYEVACEFLEKHGVKTGGEYCERGVYGHKTRTLLQVLDAYTSAESLQPIIVFTWSRSHAARVARVLENEGGHCTRVYLITGDTPRVERLRLFGEARQSQSPIIVSTSVGEEGFDLPDAGLLVFLDTPKSELRFYQRLGRLLRKSSKHTTKYLVITSTPGTFEHPDLAITLWSLSREGVDVSYIVSGLEEIAGKGPHITVEELVTRYTVEAGIPFIPYLTIRRGARPHSGKAGYPELEEPSRETVDLLEEAYERLKPILPQGGQDLDHLEKFMQVYAARTLLKSWSPRKYGVESLAESWKAHVLQGKFSPLEKAYQLLVEGSYTRVVLKAIDEGSLILAFDPIMHGNLIAIPFYLMARKWGEIAKTVKHPRRQTFTVSNKLLILPTSLLVPLNKTREFREWVSGLKLEAQARLEGAGLEHPWVACLVPQKRRGKTGRSRKDYTMCLSDITWPLGRMRVTYMLSHYNRKNTSLQHRVLEDTIEASVLHALARVVEWIEREKH